MPYADALALQEELVATIADGRARRRAAAAGASAGLYARPRRRRCRSARRAGAPRRARVPGRARRRGDVTTGRASWSAIRSCACAPPVATCNAYVRMLESALIATCEHYGVAATTPPEQTGVWVGADKIASIGHRRAARRCLPRHRPQRQHGPVVLRAHRALPWLGDERDQSGAAVRLRPCDGRGRTRVFAGYISERMGLVPS